MGNDIQIVPPAANPQMAPISFTATGDNALQVAHADTVNIHHFGTQAQPALRADTRVNHDYYNLIVVDGDDPFQSVLHIPTSQIFTTGMDKDVVVEFASLSPEVIARIKSFPTIVATLNHDGIHTGEDHLAAIGLITDVVRQGKMVKLGFARTDTIGQERLNELVDELEIWNAPMSNELDVPHWAIKNHPLIAPLAAAGYRLPGISAITPLTPGGE